MTRTTNLWMQALACAAALTLVTACEDDSDASVEGADTGHTDATPGDDTSNAPVTAYDRWGTAGVSDPPLHEPDGFALCNLQDIRTDDLANNWSDDYVPTEAFPAQPFEDEIGRCGDDAETAAWRLGNCERISRGLEPLACDLRLVWVGRMHSADMAARGYFDHVTPDGVSPFDRMESVGIDYSYAGENIAMHPSSESAHIGWMNSQGHRENLLNENFSHTGVGIANNGFRSFMLTTKFLRPR